MPCMASLGHSIIFTSLNSSDGITLQITLDEHLLQAFVSLRNTHYMKNKQWITLIGFILFAIGFLSIVLSIVGLNFSFLSFIEKPGKTFAFVVKLILLFAGFIMFYLGRMDNSVE